MCHHGNIHRNIHDRRVMNSIKGLNLRNFDCLLGCRDDLFLASAHRWHIQDPADVLGLWHLSGFLYLLNGGHLASQHNWHVNDSVQELHLYPLRSPLHRLNGGNLSLHDHGDIGNLVNELHLRDLD